MGNTLVWIGRIIEHYNTVVLIRPSCRKVPYSALVLRKNSLPNTMFAM